MVVGCSREQVHHAASSRLSLHDCFEDQVEAKVREDRWKIGQTTP